MLDNQIHCLPIVENGAARGMLTTGDLMIALDCVLQAIRELSTAGVSRNTDTQDDPQPGNPPLSADLDQVRTSRLIQWRRQRPAERRRGLRCRKR